VSDVRESLPPVEEGKPVLLSEVLRDQAQHIVEDNVQAVRHGNPADEPSAAVLRQVLLDEVDGQPQTGSEERKNSEQSGLCFDFDAGSSNSTEIGIRDGASARDGSQVGASVGPERSSASSERDQGRQQPGQSRSADKQRARKKTQASVLRDVPSLPQDVLDAGACPRCGGRLIRRPPPTVPATILDCFGGAGTTGLVADRLQRNAILIELNESYAAMAERRIAGDSPLFSQVAAE
jgi:hypothetical protein